jgi:FkbM family methyltransferase
MLAYHLRMQEIDFHRALAHVAGTPPGTIIDAGAHDGRLALDLAAIPAVRLLAFEPLPSARARLATAFAARYGAIPPHVEIRPEALGAARDTLALSVPRIRTPDGTEMDAEEWASLAKDYADSAATDPRVLSIARHDVPVIPLDDLGLTDVTAMKIDVEGFEAELIEGARQTLARSQPILSIEIEERHRPGSTSAIPALLRPLGYQGFWEFYGDWHLIEDFNPQTHQRASPSPAEFTASTPYVFTFYFVPFERIPQLAALARLPGS